VDGPLHQVAFGCSDLERSVAFYRDCLGLTFITRFDPPGIAFFRLGEVRLLLERSDSPEPGGSVLYLAVSDILHSHELLLERGVAFESGPHRIYSDDAGIFGAAGEEEWLAFFRDPDRNRLALAERSPATRAG
jgi:catechol 2,3-dioxygenase-like lactoylglutathione lyase family enzyme